MNRRSFENYGVRFVLLSIVFLLPFQASCIKAQSSSDESGTLAVAARTQKAAYLIIDSGVSNNGNLKSDASRKLFDIGRVASCGIAGHLSFTNPAEINYRFSLAAAARSWIVAHPKTKLEGSLKGVMTAMSKTFADELLYTKSKGLIASRNLGEHVSSILCVSGLAADPQIYLGEVTYESNGTISWRIGKAPQIFYVDGAIAIDDLVQSSSRQIVLINHFFPTTEGKSTFDHFLTAYQNNDSNGWDDEDVRNLLFSLFDQVEKDTLDLKSQQDMNIGVSAPNNVRVFTRSSRYAPPFEGSSWLNSQRKD